MKRLFLLCFVFISCGTFNFLSKNEEQPIEKNVALPKENGYYLICSIDTSSSTYYNLIKIKNIDNQKSIKNLIILKTNTDCIDKRIIKTDSIYKLSIYATYTFVQGKVDSVYIYDFGHSSLKRRLIINDEIIISFKDKIFAYKTDNIKNLCYIE